MDYPTNDEGSLTSKMSTFRANKIIQAHQAEMSRQIEAVASSGLVSESKTIITSSEQSLEHENVAAPSNQDYKAHIQNLSTHEIEETEEEMAERLQSDLGVNVEEEDRRMTVSMRKRKEQEARDTAKKAAEEKVPESCRGRFRGRYFDPFQKFDYSKDYRDPEPPPLDEKILHHIFQPKDPEAECWEESMKGLMSRAELRDQIQAVLHGSYKTVSSIPEAINKRNFLLQSIPKHTPRDMRRLTSPASEYLVQELEEDGFIFSRDTLARFMDLDDKIIEIYEEKEMTKLARKPLRGNQYYLIVLSEALKLVEMYLKHGRRTEVYSLYMYLGQFFEGLHSTWAWLTYELYKLAAETVTAYRGDMGFGEALVKYTLGKFVFYKLRDAEEALPLFHAAYEVSAGRNWTTEPLTRKKDEVIHTEASVMMHTACLAIANQIIDVDPKRATDLGFLAYKRIAQTGKHPEIEDALRGLARLYQQAKRPETALVVLARQTRQSRILHDWPGLINAYFLTAFCLKALKKYDKAFENLTIMDHLAVKHNEPHLEALAAKSIGEYYLTKDEYKPANDYLTRAMEKYLAVGLNSEAYRCSIHVAAARVALNMPLMIKSVLNSKAKHQLQELLAWQLTEDSVAWDRLCASHSNQEDQRTRTGYYTVYQPMLLPNHQRVRNSVYNVSDIQMVHSSQDFD